MVQQYLDHSLKVLVDDDSVFKKNRTGIDSISRFGHQNEYDLSKGFPLLTTKKVPFAPIVHELLWFLRGDSNLKYLVDNNVHIWDGNAFQHYLKSQNSQEKLPMYSPEWVREKNFFIERIKSDEEFAKQHGDLGPVYGRQWRHWKTSDGTEIDQIADVIDLLHNNPSSRRMVISAWNPVEIPDMALPPCHAMYQLNVRNNCLDLHMFQRSCDMFLGVPFNIASYALLTNILAQESNLQPGKFIHSFGDAHFYCGSDNRGKFYQDQFLMLKEKIKTCTNKEDYLKVNEWIYNKAPPEREDKIGQDHITAILEQMSRPTFDLPQLSIENKSFDSLTFNDIKLHNYKAHPMIRRSMAV